MLQLVGRRSSLFTRVALVFAEQLAVPCEFVPVLDMTLLSAETYAGNPALKLPVLRMGSDVLFGAQNICREFADRAEERATPAKPARIVWPEELRLDVSRNSQELVWHAMAAQVQLVMGTIVGDLPADDVHFLKTRAGLEGSLRWLDEQVEDALRVLPEPRDLSLFEVTLFCLVEHLEFRPTVAMQTYGSLLDFARQFARRPAAQRTAYAFDVA
jgi:Glutathione S-transferase, N-terminal domain